MNRHLDKRNLTRTAVVIKIIAKCLFWLSSNLCVRMPNAGYTAPLCCSLMITHMVPNLLHTHTRTGIHTQAHALICAHAYIHVHVHKYFLMIVRTALHSGSYFPLTLVQWEERRKKGTGDLCTGSPWLFPGYQTLAHFDFDQGPWALPPTPASLKVFNASAPRGRV